MWSADVMTDCCSRSAGLAWGSQPSGLRSACSNAVAPNPSTLTTLSRDFSPWTTLTLDGAIPIRFAIIWHKALFALPSTGGAVTRASRTPSLIPIS